MVGLVVGGATPAYAAAPTITSLSPAFGTWQGGVAVTISGTGFTTTADTSVSFGSVPAINVVVVSSTSITVTSPDAGLAAAGTTVNVTVTNTGGMSNGLPFAYANCTFNTLPAGAAIVVTPGVSSVVISCSHLQASSSFYMELTSPLTNVQSKFTVAANEALMMDNNPSLGPFVMSDASGNLAYTLAVPARTTGGNPGVTATDADGVCSPTQNEENQGLLACTVQVSSLSHANFGNALLEYPSQLAPQAPSLALSPTGSSTTTITATGTGWWGAGPGSTTIPAANIRVGCSGTNPCAGGVAALSSTLTVSPPSYYVTCKPASAPTVCTGVLTPATLSGTFVIPNGASGTIAIDQPNTSPTPCPSTAVCFAGNGPGNTVEATASSALPVATATGTGVSTWNGNVPNNAISNSGNPPNPNVFWQPTGTATEPVTYDVNLSGRLQRCRP
jgi:hypothetical protein